MVRKVERQRAVLAANVSGMALAMGMFFVPSVGHAQTAGAVCIASGSSTAQAGGACTWAADTDYSGGTQASTSHAIVIPAGLASAAPASVYQSQRYGGLTYTIPNLTAGANYTVTLHFAEIYGNTVAGNRRFTILVNGVQQVADFDVVAAAGAMYTATDKTFAATANSSGQVVIALANGNNNPIISGIEVAPSATQQTCIAVGSASASSNAMCGWAADIDYSGGTVWTTANAITIPATLTNAAPASVYQAQRYGNATYTVPNLVPGATYTVNLHFAETYPNTVAGNRQFNVSIAGQQVLSNFDVVAAAGAINTAVVKSFMVVAPSNGQLPISLTRGNNNPIISGIQVVPVPAQQTCIGAGSNRIVGGPTCMWSADANYAGGGTTSTTAAISIPSAITNAAPAAVYQSQRYGPATYTIPNLVPGAQYTVNLHFAEIYPGANAGDRTFNVAINGTPVLTNFDVAATAGAVKTAVVESFSAVASSSGQISVALTNGNNNAIINAIQIVPLLPQAATATLTMPPSANYSTIGTYTLSATANSSAPISYAVLSGPALISGSTLNVFGGGYVTIQAYQNANGTFGPITSSTQTYAVNTATSNQLNWRAVGSGSISHSGSDAPNNYFIDANGQFFLENAFSQYDTDPASHNWSFYSGSNESTATASPANSYNSSWSVNGVARPDTQALCSSGNPVWTGFTAATGLTAGSGYTDGNFCDAIGVWVDPDTGTWYGLIHNELYPNAPRIDAISLATSTDRGNSWTLQGPVLTSPYGIGNASSYYYQYGAGDQRLFVDTASGYFYVQYMTRILTPPAAGKAGGAFKTTYVEVARAPIRQKMAPGSWQKFYQGSFQNSPGIQWTCDPAVNSACPAGDAAASLASYVSADSNPVMNQSMVWPISSQRSTDLPTYLANGATTLEGPYGISWNAYLGKYVSAVQDFTNNSYINFYVTSDLSSQQWTYAGSVPYSTPDNPWYMWVRDTQTMTTGKTTGSTFDFLCTINCNGGQTVSVAFGSGATLPTYYASYDGTVSASSTYLIQHPSASVPAASGSGTGWTFTSVGDGSFTIGQNGQYLTVAGGDAGRAWGASVALAAPLAASSSGPERSRQQWFFEPIRMIGGTAAPANEYRLVNRYSGLVLSFAAAGLTTSNLGLAVTAPSRDWDPASGATYASWHVADQTLIFVAQ